MSKASFVTSRDERTHRRGKEHDSAMMMYFEQQGIKASGYHACLTLQVEGLNLIWVKVKKDKITILSLVKS